MKIVIDLDHTITAPWAGNNYADAPVNYTVVDKLRTYQNDGFEIIIHTARNMRTFNGNIGKITVHTLPIILDWLNRNEVPFDEVIIGKPWCGYGGFYVDDKAIRPDEFTSLSLEEIHELIGKGSPQ